MYERERERELGWADCVVRIVYVAVASDLLHVEFLALFTLRDADALMRLMLLLLPVTSIPIQAGPGMKNRHRQIYGSLACVRKLASFYKLQFSLVYDVKK